MQAIIFQPSKSAAQSGKARTKDWAVKFLPQQQSSIDPIMGWISEKDMMPSQVKLTFKTQEEAIRYVEDAGITYQIITKDPPKPVAPKSYSDNFKFKSS